MCIRDRSAAVRVPCTVCVVHVNVLRRPNPGEPTNTQQPEDALSLYLWTTRAEGLPAIYLQLLYLRVPCAVCVVHVNENVLRRHSLAIRKPWRTNQYPTARGRSIYGL